MKTLLNSCSTSSYYNLKGYVLNLNITLLNLTVQEGQPPSEVISPQLVVGGRLDKYASNGDTNVIINDRLITKKELWVLKVVVLNNILFYCCLHIYFL